MRTGAGNYLTMVATFFNLAIVVSLRFDVTGVNFYLLTIGLAVGFSSAAISLGHLHRRWQQDTDARLTNKILINDIAEAVISKLEERKTG